MLCPHCGTENRDKAKFCTKCGRQLTSEMERGLSKINTTSLTSLIDYYLACLAQERQLEASLKMEDAFGAGNKPPRLYPIYDLPDDWNTLLSSDAARNAAELARRREGATVVFAPLLYVRKDMESESIFLEPSFGVFCNVYPNSLSIDFADVFIGQTFARELDWAESEMLRDEIERAARGGPKAMFQKVLTILHDRGIPSLLTVHASNLNSLTPPALVYLPAFWVVGEPSYDRSLLDDLNRLRSVAPSDTSLSFLFHPSITGEVPLSTLLEALANPICPTLSQAVALAHAMTYPFTVVTGPPGTGKTRIIVGLIIHLLLNRRSVLLASRINRAVDAAVELIERLLGEGCILRTGNREAREQLAQVISKLSQRTTWGDDGELFANLNTGTSLRRDDFMPRILSLTEAQRALKAIEAKWLKLCDQINRLGRKLKPFGLCPVDSKWKAFWWNLRWWLFLGAKRWRVFQEKWADLKQCFDELHETVLPEVRRAYVLALRRRLDELLRDGKQRLQELAAALTGSNLDRHLAFESLARIGFPIALSTLSVSPNLPLKPALFDTLIIDEASSCDPASLLPLLYRARRVVIIGDPKQLTHITSERWKHVQHVPKLRSCGGKVFEAGFDLSAFHLCNQLVNERSFMLNDHFRCPPPIITFSNETFYGGELRIHTENKEPQPITVRRVSGNHIVTPTNSRRNERQLAEALKELRELAQRYSQYTIGLVAPYRAFVDDALELIAKDPLLAQWWADGKLIVGTAHRFQGSEVDYLVFATVAGDNGTERERSWVENANLFNVATTRARRQLIILLSPNFEKRLVLTKQLLSASPLALRSNRSEGHDLRKQISHILDNFGIPHRIGFSYYGYYLDFLQDSDEPRWGAVCRDWSEVAAMEPIAFLRLLDEQKALRQRGMEVRIVFPQDVHLWVSDLMVTEHRRRL